MNSSQSDNCIQCGLCTENCKFLNKYNLNLQEFENRKDLSYHCFMCGKCTEMCPQSIDGRQIALSGRLETSQIDMLRIKKEYKQLLLEKNPYIFRNYKNANYKSVIFMGCNFPSFFPKTTKRIEQLMLGNNIGIIYDCCGKPIDELGLEVDSGVLLNQLNERISGAGIEELIMVCPNCYYYLKDRLNVKVVTIYAKLRQLGLGKNIGKQMESVELPIYIPCPDRVKKEMLKDIEPFIDVNAVQPFSDIQCCGLGGCAFFKEPEISKEMAQMAMQSNCEKLYTYCASCVSNFKRSGIKEAYHVLPMILGVDEASQCGAASWIHRAKHRII